MATTKKSAAKKAPAKKAAAKKVEAEVTQTVKSIEDVAAESLQGKWGTGRDRDTALRAAGHDPALVSKEAAKQRVQQ